MNINKYLITALSAVLILFLACFPAAAGLEDETMVVEGKRVYLVKPGDSHRSRLRIPTVNQPGDMVVSHPRATGSRDANRPTWGER